MKNKRFSNEKRVFAVREKMWPEALPAKKFFSALAKLIF